jgi:hypothetical protein
MIIKDRQDRQDRQEQQNYKGQIQIQYLRTVLLRTYSILQ